MKVTAGTGGRFSVNESIVIDSEALRITAISTDDLTATTIDGTTPATHANLAAVNDYPIALHHNQGSDELIALEGFLGAPGATVNWANRVFQNASFTDILFKGSVAFNATLTHANTATRIYTFPDRALTVGNAADLTGIVPLTSLSGITNTQIAAGAAIAYSKLSLTGSLVNADVAAGAAIAYSKLNLATSIVNADINAAAAIAWTKLDKTGSSLADLTTRSAADLSSGTLLDARLSSNVALLTGSQTFLGQKTFTTGLLKAVDIVNAAATLTLPTTTDTLVGRATTDTLTNKTVTAPVLGGTVTGTYTLGGTPTLGATLAFNGQTISGNGTHSGQVSFTDATAPIITAKLGPSSGQQHTLPAVTSDTVALLAATQTLAAKTLTSPTLNGTVATTGLTMPGFTESGNIAMATFKVTGLGQGTASGEAVHAGRTLNTSAPLAGGGDLTADRTLSISTSPGAATTVVGTARLISTASGISGGGDLSADRTLTWDGIETHRITSALSDSTFGPSRILKLKEGSGVTLDVTDTGPQGTVTYTINASVAAAGGWVDDGAVVRLQTATDQVGIGTSSPNASFMVHVVGSGAAFGILTDDNLAFKSGTASIGTFDHAITGNRTWTFPDVTGTVALAEGTTVFTGSQTFRDNVLTVTDQTDTTKAFQFEASGITTATTRTYTVPNATGTLSLLSLAQVWTAMQTFRDTTIEVTDDGDTTKKAQFDAATITTGTTRTYTFPDATGTLTLNAATQTLTNKTLDSSTNTVRASSLATAASPVVVSAAGAPTAGQILTATSSTAATWQSPSAQTFTEVTGDTSAATNTRYIANKGTILTFTLPSTYSVGDYIFILGKGAGGFQVTAAAGDTIKVNNSISSSAAGTATFDDITGFVELVCTVANDTWEVATWKGTITVS